MKNYCYLLLLSSAMLSVNAQAYIFQGDIMTSTLSEDIEYDYSGGGSNDLEIDTDFQGIFTNIYFGNVSLETGPWHEAAFLDKASSLGLSFEKTKFDY